MNNTKQNWEWEKEFDERWIELYESNISRTSYTSVTEEIKDFIRQSHLSLLSELEEKIKEINKEWNGNGEYYEHVDKAVSEVLELINSYKQK